MTILGTITVLSVLSATTPDVFISQPMDQIALVFGGIVGDRHFGWTKTAGVREGQYPRGTEILNRRQISLVAEEDLERIAVGLGVPTVRPEWLGANFLVRGFPDWTRLAVGAHLLFPGGAGLLSSGENRPCRHPGEVLAQHYPDRRDIAACFVRVADHRRGIVAMVEREGTVRVGDEIRIVGG